MDDFTKDINTNEQHKKQNYEWLRKFQFKPGQSGNPKGRKPGKSMKAFVKEYLQGMTDEERIKFLNSINPETVWKMGEGNPPQPLEVGSNPELPFILRIVKDDNSSTTTERANG